MRLDRRIRKDLRERLMDFPRCRVASAALAEQLQSSEVATQDRARRDPSAPADLRRSPALMKLVYKSMRS